MAAEDLNRLLNDAVPELPEPPDRVAAVQRRTRQAQQRRAMAAVGAAVVAIGIGAAVFGVWTGWDGDRTAAPASPTSPPTAGTSTPRETVDHKKAANELVAFARDPGQERFDAIPFAGDEVILGLGGEVIKTVPTADLVDPAQWRLHVEEFEGWAGPFSALETLSEPQVETSVGAHKQCVSPPTQAPDGLSGLTQVAIQPSGTDSCIDWFAVDVYTDDRGRIVGLRLDLFAP